MSYRKFLSTFFIFLQFVFLLSANSYAYNTLTVDTNSCCSEESEGCCGGCEVPISPAEPQDNCCHGTGCCGWQLPKIPTGFSTHFKEEKIEVSKHAEVTLPFILLRLSTTICSDRPQLSTLPNIYHLSLLREDKHAFFCIWRC